MPALTLASLIGAAAASAEDTPWGFSGLEIYTAGNNTRCLKAVDVDGDGLTDLAIINNEKTNIEFYIQKTRKEFETDLKKPPEMNPAKPNDIPSDRRFRHETYLTEKQVFSWDFADMTGDGRPDLVYHGDPRELVVVPRLKDGGWSKSPLSWKILDGLPGPEALATGDFNGDGRADVALLAEEKTYFLHGAGEGLAEAIEMPNPEKGVVALRTGDFNGDKRTDLLYLLPSTPEPLRVRFQEEGGLGAMVAFTLNPVRSWAVADADRDGRSDVFLIDEVSGHLKAYRFESKENSDGLSLPVVRYTPLEKDEAGRTRCHAVADITGDGRADVLVTLPGIAQVALFAQTSKGTLAPPVRFPILSGVTGLSVADLDGDKKNEILLLSPDEKSLGVTRWDKGRIDFPASVPVTGKPVVLDVGDLDGDGAPDWVYVVKNDSERKLVVWTAGLKAALDRKSALEGAPAPVAREFKLTGAPDDPERLALFDANQDGRPDVILFYPYDAMRVWLNQPGPDGKGFTLTDVTDRPDFGKGLVEKAVAASFFPADLNRDGKPEMILARQNYARALFVGPGNALTVLDQFAAKNPKAQVAGVAALRLDDDPDPEVVLLDKARSQLTILKRNAASNAWEVVRTRDVPRLSFRMFAVADLDGDRTPDIFLGGEQEFLILPAKGAAWQLKAAGSFATDVKGGRLKTIAVGDLDGGNAEIITMDTKEQLLKILRLTPKSEIAQGLSFRVFEAKSFQRQQNLEEPREIIVADVTGDGIPDIIALAHDRILVYPQEK
ncbi:MAG: VCBS repeat-containing protein [Planctomycetota bacterium]